MEHITGLDNDEIMAILQLLTVLGIIAGLFTLRYQKKEIHFSTIQRCIDIHRKILRDQQSFEEEETEESKIKELSILTLDHLGLINEELFYMKKGYLPKKLSKAWLSDMTKFVPIYVKSKNEKLVNEEQIRESKEIKQFINSSVPENKNFNTYLKERKLFSQITKVFTLKENFYKKLLDEEGKLNFTDKNRNRMASYFWLKTRHTMFCRMRLIMKDYYAFIYIKTVGKKRKKTDKSQAV